MARLLIAAGASLVDMPNDGMSPLFAAIDNDHVDTAKLLITAGVDVNARNPRFVNETPLLRASWQGKVEMVNVLLTAGADVNLVTKHGGTPLQVAKNDEVAAAILDHIANMQNKTSLSSVDSLFANSLTVNNEIKAPGTSPS